ncbi:MAG TPA: hypothetical protein VL490_00515 [Mucilaginibacter sp.]|jgi:hypothetical protein|nr:hypothetical protein [Mucilaginibacter sp.]
MKLFLKLTYPVLVLLLFFSSAHAQQKDDPEAKVPAYTLPEILKTTNGKTVNSVADWENTRRPEILSLFETEVYGKLPKEFDKITYTVTNDVPGAMDGKAHLKQVDIKVWRANRSVTIHLILFTPNNHKGPAPAFVLINNRGESNTDPTRKKKSEFWPAEMAIDSGYAIAAFNNSDVAPDNKDTYKNGLLKLYPELASAPDGMKAISAWAWGASRVMDYFKTDKDIDFNKVGVVGHSRGGKTALWVGALDKRFAMVFASCSGNTGASIARRRFGEKISDINRVFPHWFDDNYKKYSDDEAALPVDQHMLLALIAPRPLYTTNATKDLWADPKGSYLSVQLAQQVYDMYGKHSALPPVAPPPNTPIIKSAQGYHIREGVHNLTAYDWGNFIKFANYHYYNK